MIILSLGGCVKLLPEASEPSEKVKLSGPLFQKSDLEKANLTVIVSDTTARDFLKTSRIAVENQSTSVPTLDYIASAEWDDVLPKVIQRDLRLHLNDHYRAVPLEEENLRGHYSIQSDVETFQAIQEGKHFPHVEVGLHLKVVQLPLRSVVASETFLVKEQVKANGRLGVFEAFRSAYANALQRASLWIVEAIKKEGRKGKKETN
jgi:ABC-type uncharacterized transport system auxiliary subunit